MTSSVRPSRVTYLVTSSSVGGAEQQVRALALEFARRGWVVGVISMLPLEPFLLELRELGVAWRRSACQGAFGPTGPAPARAAAPALAA
ncbi:MAG: hypothetical protein H0T59_03975 [Chloroflexi bacterium]|nr:hypothetical protein [Chloroflexota bacterium]